MKIRRYSVGLVAACVTLSWLTFSLLDRQLSPRHQNVGRDCHCSRESSRECGCLPGVRLCSACLWRPGESPWFDSHYERAIEPLQRSEDSISYDALILWLGLQRVKPEQKVDNKQWNHVSSHHELGRAGSSCLTCAVVGSSRSLKGSGHGFRINQHDLILRMNQAPVQGFEVDVGNRTSIRIMYPETARAQEPGTQLLLLPLNSSGLEWFIKTLHLQHSARKPQNPGFQIVHFPSGTTEKKDQVLVISLSFLKYIQEQWLAQQGIHPSLGFVALLYALHTCDQVSLFGFGEDHLQRWSHYWDNSYWFKKSAYFPAESQVIRQLQCNKKIRNYS